MSDVLVPQVVSGSKFDIFFSHPWKSKPFLAHVYKQLVAQGFRVWYDEREMGFDLRRCKG